MFKLRIPESFILKIQYELSQWQPDDPAYEIASVIIKDEVYAPVEQALLLKTLEDLSLEYEGQALMEALLRYVVTHFLDAETMV